MQGTEVIFEHEIPEGTKLYFGKSARIKRQLESYACEVFASNGFEEIVTPYFSYLEHQQNISDRHIIRLNSQNNHQISLRYDSTIDTIRILTKRLGRAINHQKWFYIQPVFSYPTNEIYQIGAECLNPSNFTQVIKLCLQILEHFHLKAHLQISNAKILRFCLEEIGLDSFSSLCLEEIIKKAPFMKELVSVSTINDLERYITNAPMFLKFECERLLQKAKTCEYPNTVISLIERTMVAYYDDIVYKGFLQNSVLFLGGKYKIQDCICGGVGIYTDNVITKILAKVE